MAACDNLYGNEKEWEELRGFFLEKKPEYIKLMKNKPTDGEEDRICYTADIQKWLIEHCPLPWVQESLDTNIHIQRMILGMAHHERIDGNHIH